MGRISRGCLVGLDSSNPDFLQLLASDEKRVRNDEDRGTSTRQG